jgi:uncharacterized oligopeptide transporter (OPT) family protein
MESKSNPIEPLLKELEELIKTSLELWKYKLIKQSSVLSGSFIFSMMIMSILIIFFLFLAVACSFFMGKLLGSNAIGFLIVAGVFFLLFLLLIFGKSYFNQLISQKIIHFLLS